MRKGSNAKTYFSDSTIPFRQTRLAVTKPLSKSLAKSIESPFLCDYGYNIIFRGRAFINFGCKILDEAKVIFGENAFIGPGCGFYTACHPLDHSKRNKGIEWAKPITVGNNVWLGGDVTVLPGVTIGDNSVIGAGSVVTKDIPANCVAAGNPCKKIREI
mgnify:CR=1 FL=1